MTKSYRITGADALRIAARDNLTLHCHANPIDDGGIVTVAQGHEIAREDASLLYVIVQPAGWTGDATGYNVCDYFQPGDCGGSYNGADDDGVEPIWADAAE